MRLLTRSDFDGICCAALLKEVGVIGEMVYAHPKDLQDGKIKVTGDDILANVPYVAGCGLWFDHHSSERERLDGQDRYEGTCWPAPSTARIVYEFYGRENLERFDEMVNAVDRVDSGQLTREEILEPKGWVLLGLLCDPRTGLGYRRDFPVSNLDLTKQLVDLIRSQSIDQILGHPDVKERVDYYFASRAEFEGILRSRSRVDGPIVITDTRGVTNIPPGNRFLIYALYPEANIDVRLIDGKQRQFVSISVGHSILNRSSSVNVGSLMLKYGGGGHHAVGTCQVPYDDAERVLAELVAAIKEQS